MTRYFLRPLVLAAVSVAAADATDCTSAQIAELSTLRSNVTAVCGSDALSSSATAATYCDDSACLALLTGMVSSVPSCEVSSYNLRSVLASAISSCDAASDAVPALKSSAPSPLRSALLQVLAVAAALLTA